jgi:hypothetical protein
VAVEIKPIPEKAKSAAKKATKPKAVVVKPPSAVVPEGPASQEAPPEPTPAKPSSRRKAAKEAVLV